MQSMGRDMKASVMMIAARTILATTAIVGLVSAAGAAELNVPQTHPEVVMDIPDGWTMEQSSTGFEMRSPEKDSIIIGRTLGRDKKAVDTWRQEAGEKFKAFGVSFDPNAKAPPPPSPANPAETLKPDDKKTDKTSAFTTSPDTFTFSGAPSLKPPGTEGSNDPVKPGDLSVESLTGFGTTVGADMPKLPFRAVQYYGTTMNSKPVDVQLLIYNLPANRLFVMMQESGADDGRAVAMARSVRGAK